MPDIAWPLSSRPGPSAEEGAGRLINCYVEELGQGGRSPTSIRRAPGLSPFCDLGGPLRGALTVGQTVYAAIPDRLLLVAADGTITDGGPLPGSGRVYFNRNNRSPLAQVVAVTEYALYDLPQGAWPKPLPIPTPFPLPNSCDFLFGFFFFTGADGTSYASAINGEIFSGLDYTKEQGRSAGLMRAVAFRSELFLFGPSETGVYGAPAQANGFPLSRITGIPRGLIGPSAVAGAEQGWSNELIWVGDDAVVYALTGYQPKRISNHDIERDIAAQAQIDASAIEAGVFMVSGHAFFALSMPGRTWVHDLTTGQWHERASHGMARWRGRLPFKAFGRWLVGDISGTQLLEVREDALDEAGQPLTMIVESLPGESFPQRLAVPRADFDFVVGKGLAAGTPNAVDPSVLASWSDDGSATFSSPLRRSLGAIGRTRTRVTLLRTGMTGVQGRTWRLEISDPVYVALVGGGMAVEARTE